jgi:hypothetical protein
LAVLLRVQEVLCYNRDVIRGVPQCLQVNSGAVTQIRQRPFPCMSFPVHYSPIIPPFDASEPRQLIQRRFINQGTITHEGRNDSHALMPMFNHVRDNSTHFRDVWSRDSSVGIATSYGFDGPGLISGSERFFLFSTSSTPALGPTHPPVQSVPGADLSEVKAAGA